MTFKTIIYAGLIATAGFAVIQSATQAASIQAMKNATLYSARVSGGPGLIKVHNPYYGYYARRYYFDNRPNFSSDQYNRYSHSPPRKHKSRHYKRTCVTRRDYPRMDETGLNMPPWEWVPC